MASLTEDYNKAAQVAGDPNAKAADKKAAMRDIHQMERANRNSGIVFRKAKDGPGFEARQGASKSDLQGEYVRKFKDPAQREAVAKRLGVKRF